MDAPDLLTLRDRLMAFATNAGCCSAGACNQAGLEGGPPSTDLTRQLEGARAALVFAFPVDEAKLELYMGKIDHGPHQEDYIRTNNTTSASYPCFRSWLAISAARPWVRLLVRM